ncbi:MAG: Xaa-Pro peptidase family protein [Candidatus Omnitrophica bacterium]|nr:Xaa-Pro peptidase family protein [Candidatus Omnitrophota bacterium]
MKQALSSCLAKIRELHLDAFLISDPLNIAYLTDFSQGADGYLLVSSDAQLFYFTNFLYEAVARQVKCWKVIAQKGNIFKHVAGQIEKLGAKKAAFEPKHIPFLEYKKIKESLDAAGVDFYPAIDLIEKIRAIKTKEEISYIQKSTLITKEALDFVSQADLKASTEKELSIEIERFLKLKGDNEVAFPTIVASGKNSAYPHHVAGTSPINKNIFLIDLGSKYYKYCADLTRVFFEGKISTSVRKIYDIVRKAQELSIAKIKDGAKASEVDAAARGFINKKGYGKYFGHGLGHGVGIAVHELPFINAVNEESLREGMVITVEPAIYLEGKFGIRIEDMVLVESQGCKVLSA